ncbi:MAG: type II secretion system protein GspE, partial [Nitrospirota bacterium]
MIADKLGKLLVGASLLTDEQLEKALLAQKKDGGRLGNIIVKLGYLDEGSLIRFLSQRYSIPAIDLNKCEIDPSIIKLVPQEVVQKHHVI